MLLPPATVSPGTSGCPLCRAAAAVVIAVMVMGGIGIFAIKQTLFEVDGTVEAAKEISMQPRAVVAQALTPEEVAAMGLPDVSGAGRDTYNPLDAMNTVHVQCL